MMKKKGSCKLKKMKRNKMENNSNKNRKNKQRKMELNQLNINYQKQKLEKELRNYVRVLLTNVLIMLEKGYLKVIKLFFLLLCV